MSHASNTSHVSNAEASQLLARTEELEAEKDLKRWEREQRKLEREQKQKSQFLEKLVAPTILIITILISLALVFIKN